MASVADTSASILLRVVNPKTPALSATGAQEILALDFPAEDRSRMNELAAKARDGKLSASEQDECRGYEQIGHLLSLLHSKARLTLKNPAN
jgi:hypothetical protein